MSSPYREAPLTLVCPRCSEVLDNVFGGVAVCTRCEGAWVQQPVVVTAFGNPRWPAGQNLWWRAELDCPECALAGTTTRMDARNADNIMVDLCSEHGVWLDQGELSRLMQLGAGSDELLALQKRVSGDADPDDLARRRMLWRNNLETKRKKTAEVNAWLEQQKARKEEEAAAAAKRREAAEAEARRRADAAAEALAVAARAEEQIRREALARHAALLEQRAATVARRDKRALELERARYEVTSLELMFTKEVASLAEIDNELKKSEVAAT